jgi:CspA family cold shock protein
MSEKVKILEEIGVKEGTVKFWNETKGFGFLIVEGLPDVFVHYSSIQMKGYRNLKQGQKVEVEVVRTERGYSAKMVRVNSEVKTDD